MIKVVADIDIPYLQGVLEPYAQVEYMKGKSIDAAAVKGADALFVRTRTRCDSSLLEGSQVKFIATATIGTDHIDQKYLTSRNIAFASAPGCNSGGVMQYVHTALFAAAAMRGIDLREKTLGVIGVGNTGGKVAALGEHLGFKVLRNDPPKKSVAEDKSIYCSLDYLLEHSDIVTMHVPLDSTTRGMAERSFFSKIAPGSIFINASRGEVVDDASLLAKRGELSALILDVWNGEPDTISQGLIESADIATPHIAGYSFEGKINGTAMSVQAFARYFGIGPLMDFVPEHTPTPEIELRGADGAYLTTNEVARRLLAHFPIYDLDNALRSAPDTFEKIRAEYNYRREFVWK